MLLSDFSLPAISVNNYLWDTMKRIDPTLQKTYKNTVPFFPLSDAASGNKSWENKTYVIYDRVLKFSRNSFYPIKKEQIVYAVKGKEESTLEWSTAIQYILDRMDDAAQDINDWNRQQPNPAKVYFHHLRVYQTDSGNAQGLSVARDFSNRPFYITQFIVDVEYHFTDSIEQYLS